MNRVRTLILSMENLKYSFKVVVAGDPEVGKTSMVRVFATGKFEKNYIPTLGVNILSKNLNFKNVEVAMAIWDLAGQGFMDEVRGQYYSGARAAILVYDITRADTFARIVAWNEECKKFSQGILTKIIVGNKLDLDSEREVATGDGIRLAEEIGAGFVETSAKTGANIEVMFTECAKSLLKSQLMYLENRVSFLTARDGMSQPAAIVKNESGR
ncbi:MAG: Rab family GTPase [Promethearchaeati archaeon SRVP18_Atabeyarchaeia-1]